MTEPPVREAHCKCCGGFCGHGNDLEYCGACIRGGEPPEEWSDRRVTFGSSTPNLVTLRGYEFEEIVPWGELIEEMQTGDTPSSK